MVVDQAGITEKDELILPHSSSATNPSVNESMQKDIFYSKRVASIQCGDEHASWSNKKQCMTTTAGKKEEFSLQPPTLSSTSVNEVREPQPIQQNSKEISPSKEEEPIFVVGREELC